MAIVPVVSGGFGGILCSRILQQGSSQYYAATMQHHPDDSFNSGA